MLKNVLTLAVTCLVAANAVQLGKCKSKSEPVFLDNAHGDIEVIEIVGDDPATWGPAEPDLEKAIEGAVAVLAEGEDATQGEMEAAFGGVVTELVEEVAEAGGEEEFLASGPVKPDKKEEAAQNFIDEAGNQ